MNELLRNQILGTIKRMERNADAHEDQGQTDVAAQLRHWAEQFRETLKRCDDDES